MKKPLKIHKIIKNMKFMKINEKHDHEIRGNLENHEHYENHDIEIMNVMKNIQIMDMHVNH